MKRISDLFKKTAGKICKQEFKKRVAEHRDFYSRITELPDPFPVKKLTVEILGPSSLSKPVTSKVRIFADGRQLPMIQHFSLDASSDSAYADVRLVQSKLFREDGGFRVGNHSVNLNWVEDYDSLPDPAEAR